MASRVYIVPMLNGPGTPTRVVTIEDDARYRASLEVLLRHSQDFVLAGSYTRPAEALAVVESGVESDDPPEWDLVLMDLDMPGMGGVEGTRRIKALLPHVVVVVLTVFEDRVSIVDAICAGADGYLLKRISAGRLLEQLRGVIAGGSPLSSGVARTVLDVVRQIEGQSGAGRGADPEVELTDRERDVLACLVNGMSYKAAAHELGISVDTVRSHIRNIYGKLQVHSVGEAVGRALRSGLV